MIDLSYLTEEEQEMIMKVLKRDSDLKKSEDDRVQKLQKTEKDGNKLKYMTGEWFYEAKSKRHRDKIHGSDIIRASMRRKKPVTLYELSQSRGEKPSWVNTVNKDVFLPPELEGLIEQPEDEVPLESTLSNSVQAVADPQIDQPRQTSTSAGKERQNPFNDYSLADDMLTFPHEALPIENSLVLPETTPGELLSTPKSTVDSVRVSNTEIPVSSEERDAQVPVPKKRTIVPKQQDFVKENEKPLPRSQSKADQNGNLPKGILKRSSSSSSNDSEILRNNSSIQGPNSNRGFLKSNSIKTQSSMEKTEEGSQNSLDRKQVRFSPTVKQKEFPEKTQISDGKELGEHGLLESELDRSQMLSSVTLEQDERKSEEISGLLQTNDFSQSNTFTNNQTQSPHKNRQQENNEVTLPALGATRENSPATTEISQWIQSSNEYIDIPINGPHTKVLNTPGEENADQHEFYAEPKSSQVCSPPSANADKEDGKEKNVHNPPAVHVKTEKYHLPVVEGSSRIATYDDDSILLKPGFDEESNPIMMALRRSKNKPLASSKSLEDITAATSDERSFNNLRDDLVMSAEDDLQVESPQSPKDTISGFSTVPSSPVSMVSDPEKIKQMSKSVPAFLQQESDDRETDSTSESSFPVGRHKKTASSLTNLSSSSGMASLSSVSGSVMSVYSGDFGNVDVKGNIQFALDYVSKLKELHIFVVQCKDLAAAEPKKQRSDPYVKSYLLPDKAKMGKRKTSVKKKTLNPTFNEILRYKIDNDTLKTQTLNLSVWHNDTFGRNSFLGEVDVDLASWNWEDKQMNWFPLRPRTPSASQGLTYRGEMKVALRFDPQPSHGKKTSSTGEVYIWVKDCKNLPMLRSSGINSFVKCSVLPDTSRKSRQKTRIVKKSANPLFNHTMVYDGFRPDDLKEACVELTVWDHDKLVNHFLGGLRLGLGTGKSYGTAVDWMDSSADEATLWERMIDTPNEWVEDVLPLRMLTMAKMSGK
ncbi:synaptotagmin-like protein 2 isoform X6 [Erpetoichthys calabaricus]|uniref:synaptotagmin-like protein 2 isoform X6 n=1 Tax=Erpetoichthys calabaricus TaxID=27687 RepID=UPI0022345E83|nr:synaptotagmin-like protein 2 isoform X6 [Erpetoichthys calabaricus]